MKAHGWTFSMEIASIKGIGRSLELDMVQYSFVEGPKIYTGTVTGRRGKNSTLKKGQCSVEVYQQEHQKSGD
ncbi:hypothetical protein HPP92_016735 [Vanilla planifolia]|uniref:Uncharacterized protein n=1 Tax=Vanilla planifolia TaxID=51239 RepID=A0A835URJ6_VANPL|nr:hypothetical protein HPP92_016735 [Vanilla planifolia]